MNGGGRTEKQCPIEQGYKKCAKDKCPIDEFLHK